jgi:uncharacterized membrane protein
MTFTRFLRRLNLEVRLALSIGLGVLITLMLFPSQQAEISLLAGWDISILSYLGLISLNILSATPEQTLRLARVREPNFAAILVVVVTIACSSIFIIGFMLIDIKTTPQPQLLIQIWLSLIAILCSWLLTHTMFALHYARIFYNEADKLDLEKYVGGLEFPTDEPPDYFDFLYFAFTISMTSQTSDISIASRTLRRLVLAQEFVSFFFYSIIIATIVNTVASLV